MTNNKKKSNSQVLCDAVVEGMQENKAQDIVVLDLREVENTVTDFFVVCTGESSTQINGISDSIVRFTRTNLQERPWHVEGKGNTDWVLIDYVSVVAHVFYKDARHHIDIEGLWSDAKRIDVPNLN